MSQNPCARPGCGHDIGFHTTWWHFACGLKGEATRKAALLNEDCPCPGYRTPEQQEALVELFAFWDGAPSNSAKRIADRVLKAFP